VALSLSSHRDGGATTIVADGDLDLASAPELEREIAAVVTGEVAAVVVDLSAVAFLDSAGINALLKGRRLAQERGLRYRVAGATDLVRQVLEMTGVWSLLGGVSESSN
jgi:anti-sigma B factor antagonist